MRYLLLGLSAVIPFYTCASIPIQEATPPPIAQPTTCISSQFTSTGTQHWKQVILKLTNQCGTPVDFQNATITFKSKTAISTSFWGDFAPLPYPDNNLTITSQSQSDSSFLATLNLHFPSYPGSTTMLPAGSSIQLKYGVPSEDHIEGSTSVYLQSTPSTGTIRLKNNSTKPANVTQNYALVHITMNGQAVKDVQLGWGATTDVTGLATGNYNISPENVADTTGNTYQGTAVPSTLTLTANQTATSTITYTAVQNTGKISIKLQSLPSQLNGYTGNPSVLLTQTSSGTSTSQALAWNTTTTVSQLKNGSAYSFSTAAINYNNYKCTPTFNPTSAIANATTVPVVNLTYQCVQIAQANVTLNVRNAPTTLTSLKVTLTPNDNTAPIVQTITLANGAGSKVVDLTEGAIYTVSADNVSGYSVSFSPQPLTATANGVETITFTPNNNTANGRIITYIPGWKTPPSAQALANAGYTHAMIAFGVFSTTNPGAIVPAFDMVTKEYIQSLHTAGIKVILSLGGALTSIPNTSVDFHQVLSAASSPDAFKQTFINSLNGLITQYGFDGFDIDIEHGINAGGTFSQPQGDIAVLASIINTMYQQNSALLITLTPQVANIAATSGFDQTWGNYAALIMQTHQSLAWVGIQVYNTGCAYGIDLVCYADLANSPNLSVAMATDLLENWPATINGRATGFQPYISYLKPSQVVLGYPAPNASGASDGLPAKPTNIIKRALECLKTAVKSPTSCDTYAPPRAYGAIGGVFNWEVTYDQNNNFKFATDLKNCVLNGNCN
ncbi:chitinase [Legionella beliardensis]|uniref:chitinase n=1 Tax=Legionella beliardensis TaxID=91822 RepID=A0A378I2W4_9GAMM|nr:glycosyl hydrolase family 18 protein [Legionella beliardensis]STX29080.1 chitinase [Legionella beliardensis]